MITQEKQQNLLSYITKKVKDEEDAKDILQDSYLEYLQKKDTVEIRDPFSYLFKIVHFKIKAYHHKKPVVQKYKDYLTVELNNSASYNEGLYAYDIQKAQEKVNCCPKSYIEPRLSIRWQMLWRRIPHSFVEIEENQRFYTSSYSFLSKKSNSFYKLHFREVAERKNLDAKFISSRYKIPMKEVEILNFLEKLKVDTKINMIRIYSKGIEAFSTNDPSFCKNYKMHNTKHKKCTWIFIKDSQIKMLK